MLYRLFIKAIDCSIDDAVGTQPRNLKQYYADMMMLLRVEIEFGC